MCRCSAKQALQVFGRQVLATIIKTPEKYGRIFAPFVKNTQEAIVHSVGPDRNDLRQGDRILYRPYSIVGFEFEGTHYVRLSDDEVLAVVED
jgi:co-chaperonin GroES (HSP10)